MTTKRLHLHIYGRVQGVFYRATTCDEAQRLGLTGWVRNCPDGSVELIAEGPEKKLIRLREWCRQGPPAAAVERIEEAWSTASGEFCGYSLRQTERDV